MPSLVPKLPSVHVQILQMMTFEPCAKVKFAKGSKVIIHNNFPCGGEPRDEVTTLWSIYMYLIVSYNTQVYFCICVPLKDSVLKLADFGSCKSVYSKQPYTEYISTRW